MTDEKDDNNTAVEDEGWTDPESDIGEDCPEPWEVADDGDA